MVFEIVMGVVTLFFLLAASYSDLKTREVPDLLSYGLIISALGIRTIFAPTTGWELIWSGALGLLFCFLIAWVLYKTNLWGGGDSKLLMGMGAVIGIAYPLHSSSLLLLWFFVLLLIVGAFYGLSWLTGLSITHRKACQLALIEKLKQYKTPHGALGMFSFAAVVFSFLNIWWLFLLLPLALFYLFLFVTTVEEECFVKRISPSKLTEGDWLSEEVLVDDERFPRRRALEKLDIETLQAAHREGKLPSVVIREGVPFVPSFLFAYILVLWGLEPASSFLKMTVGL
ncbi:prepilin peptidase [Candidatus Woesearchaeota archaeon]|nr:prepilin peptidase [Candidatus Woesearchaeota archaeon]